MTGALRESQSVRYFAQNEGIPNVWSDARAPVVGSSA